MSYKSLQTVSILRHGLPRAFALFAVLATISIATGHDGGFGHSRRTMFLGSSAEGWVIEYRVKLGDDEALVEMTLIDQDFDGQISAAERDRYFGKRGAELGANLRCTTDAGVVSATFLNCHLDHSLVQVYRFGLKTDARSFLLEDRNYHHKPGLIRILTGKGVTADVATELDLSHADRVRLKVSHDKR